MGLPEISLRSFNKFNSSNTARPLGEMDIPAPCSLISEYLSKPNKYLNYTYSNIYRYFRNKKYVSPNLLDTLNIEKIIFEILNKAK